MSDSKVVREWMATHSGEKCSNCGTTYRACTKKVFGANSQACCDDCADYPTHDEKGNQNG